MTRSHTDSGGSLAGDNARLLRSRFIAVFVSVRKVEEK